MQDTRTTAEKIIAGYYDTKLPYLKHIRKPEAPTATEVLNFLMEEEKLGHFYSVGAAKEMLLAAKVKEHDAYSTARSAYQQDAARLMNQFWHDCAEEHGILGTPWAKVIAGRAWETGHVYGLNEVYVHYCGIVEAFKPLIWDFDLVPKLRK